MTRTRGGMTPLETTVKEAARSVVVDGHEEAGQ